MPKTILLAGVAVCESGVGLAGFACHYATRRGGLGHQLGPPKKSAKYRYPLCAVRPPSRPRRPRVRKNEIWLFEGLPGLVGSSFKAGSTQLVELRRSRKVSAPEDTIPKSYDYLQSESCFNKTSIFWL